MSDFAYLRLSETECVIGSGESCWEKTPSKRGSFYFPDFFLEAETPFLSFSKILKEPLDLEENFCSAPSFEPCDKELFLKMFALFRASPLKKAVPYTFLTSQTVADRPLFFSLFKHLLNATSGLMLTPYAFWKDGMGILGATPELLFRRRGDLVETAALAGTAFSGKPFTEKDFKEHEFVVEGIKASLQPFGSLNVGKRETIALKTLTHLKTSIALLVEKEVSFEALTRALHPTAALGTYPKCWELLKQYCALSPRGRFGAPVGFVNGDEADLFVAIRNVQFDRGGMRIGAGCGVIHESQEDEEWLEVCAKLNAVEGFLGL